jgi:phosphohistidine phosphatase
MRNLYLLRHAKSSWKDESLADFERPLSGRGQRACLAIARFIVSDNLDFDLAICSTAVRARETMDLIKQRAKLRTEVRYDERVYEATASRLLQVVSEIESDKKSVILVGHNPGFEELMLSITGERLAIPTGALSQIDLKVSKWSDTIVGKGTLSWIVKPKDLEDEDGPAKR